MKNWPTPKTPRKDANVVVSANAQSAATQPTTTQSAHTALALRNVAPNASSAAPPAMVPNTPGFFQRGRCFFSQAHGTFGPAADCQLYSDCVTCDGEAWTLPVAPPTSPWCCPEVPTGQF
eukprot:166931-Chlamydomonas_euryale.AAC.4